MIKSSKAPDKNREEEMVSLVGALVIQKTKGTTRIEKIDALVNWNRF